MKRGREKIQEKKRKIRMSKETISLYPTLADRGNSRNTQGSNISDFINTYKSFDRLMVTNKLQLAYQEDSSVHLKIIHELKYVIRKHLIQLGPEKLLQLFNCITDPNLCDRKIKLLQAQAIKYSLQAGEKVDVDTLVHALKNTDDRDAKSEITYALSYFLKNCEEQAVEENTFEVIKQITSGDDVKPEAKSFLYSQISKREGYVCSNLQRAKFGKSISAKYQYRNEKKVIVTKVQQQIKQIHKNNCSEENMTCIQNLSEALKNRNKSTKANSNTENIPTVPQQGGNDRSFWSGTYVNVKNLYQKVVINKSLLKSDDKDNYLVSKLLANTKWNSFGKIGDFLIERMIVAIFLEISKRKANRQLLTEKAISKLILLLDDFDTVKNLVFSKISDKDIAVLVFYFSLPNSDLNQIEKSLETKRNEILDIFCIIEKLLNKQIRLKNEKELSKPIKSNEQNQYNFGIFSSQLDILDVKNNEELITKLVSKINEELEQLRVDAIETIYYQFIQRKFQYENKYNLQQIQNCIDNTKTNSRIKKFAIQILSALNNKDIDYKRVFYSCLSELENNQNTMESVEYIDQQTKDPARCQQLFGNDIILRISKLLTHSTLDQQIKLSCCEIINNCLDYTFNQGLEEDVLEDYCLLIKDKSSSSQLKADALRSILITADKNQSLPKRTIEQLINNLDQLEDQSVIFIIISLGYVCEKQFIRNTTALSYKILDTRVIYNQNSVISFEQPSKDFINYPSISLIVAKILLNSFLMGGQVSEKTLEYLVQALGKTDKLTRILSARALNIAAEQSILDEQLLIQLRDYVEDSVVDVSIYVKLAYTKNLQQRIKCGESIQPTHINFLDKIYEFDNLRLGELDFTDKLNQGILQVLQYEAGYQQFENDLLFKIFDHILFSNDIFYKEAVQILQVYSSCQHIIPQSTILALENVLGFPDVYDKTLTTLGNVIMNGQTVSEKTLKIFSDNLYLHENKQIREKSFEILNISEGNQDISDEIFGKLELQRAGNVIQKQLPDKMEAISFLYLKTNEGFRLPIDTLECLANDLYNKQVLSILYQISKNQQSIPTFIIEELSNNFNPSKKNQDQLIDIFGCIVSNNASLPQNLYFKLERSLKTKDYFQSTLQIFALIGQRGEQVSPTIVMYLCKSFLNSRELQIMKQLISTLSSLIETSQYDHQIIQQVLIKGVASEDNKINEDSINGFFTISKQLRLNQESIKKLTKKALNINTDDALRNRIILILQSQQLDDKTVIKLKLLNLKCDSNLQLLNNLHIISIENPLLQLNFMQICQIIENEPNLRLKAIQLLMKCKNKQDVTTVLIDCLLNISLCSTSLQMKKLQYDLILLIVEAGKILTNKQISLLMSENESRFVELILKMVSKNQKIPVQAAILLRIVDAEEFSINKTKLNKLLNDIYDELENGFMLPEWAIKKLADLIQKLLNNGILDSNIDQICGNIFVKIMQTQQSYSSNNTFVYIIEQVIFSMKINKSIIQGYAVIIKSKTYNKINEVIDKFTDLLEQGTCDEDEIDIEILKCISLASEIAQITEKGIIILENNLDNSDELIRYLSFRGLKACIEKGSKASKSFNQWYESVFSNLKHITGKTELKLDLELLETLVSLRSIDLNCFINKPQIEWNRELLLSDLLVRSCVSEEKKIKFYKNWLDVEESNHYLEGKSLKILKILFQKYISSSSSFKDINEVFRLLPKIDFETSSQILLNSSNYQADLSIKLIQKLLLGCMKLEISENYLKKLSFEIFQKFNFKVIETVFNSISMIQNLNELEDLLNFIEENPNIKLTDIAVQKTSINLIKRSLEIKLLLNQIQSSLEETPLLNTIGNLLEIGFTFKQLNELFSCCNSSENNQLQRNKIYNTFISVLKVLEQYNMTATNYENVLTILKREPQENWLKEINLIAVEANFDIIGKIKNLEMLIQELKENNKQNQSIIQIIENKTLFNLIEQIKNPQLKSKLQINYQSLINYQPNQYCERLCFPPQQKCIVDWNAQEIYYWCVLVNKIRQTEQIEESLEYIAESLAVIKRAYLINTGFHLTDTQIISSILMILKNNTQGRLLQVATGEGKSTIICVVAIYRALIGRSIDVNTSSPVLAERDALEKANFYKMFGLSCADNCDKSICYGRKDCYLQNIVYGQESQFKFDYLRDNYSQQGTLAGRLDKDVFADEVDCMLIDDSSKIARLSSTIPGLDQLQPIYHFIWNRLNYLQERIVEIDRGMYLLYGKVSYQEGNMILKFLDEKEQKIIEIPDLKQYIYSNKNISNIGFAIETDIQEFIKQQIEKFMNQLLNKNIKIPNHFIQFVESQMPKWIENAFVAFCYQENVNYVVHDGAIKPVDYSSTGVIQSSTNWSDGLHQFLQIKHSLKMTSETFTTNFLSNSGYFKEYGSNIYGLTGTLGSLKARQVLSEVYNVDFVIIPSSRKKQYLQYQTIITSNQTQWLIKIIQQAIEEAQKQRGTLIICETIEQTTLIANQLKQEYRVAAIKLYTMNDMNQERNVEVIRPGEIIIATNLAGRGTDIKTDEIENYGGLHVIVTFMPPNQRVEDQAFGRTARQGKRGTGCMILNATRYGEYGKIIPQKVKEFRDNLEIQTLDEFQNKDLKIIEKKDILFRKFCQNLNEKRIDIRENQGLLNNLKNLAKSIFNTINPIKSTKLTVQTVYEINVLQAIEERWAMFLQKVDDGTISIEQSESQYNEFLDQINKDYKNNSVIKNPFYHIMIANDYILQDSSLEDQYQKAIDHLDQAIELDKQFCAAAYAGKAWIYLKGREKLFLQNKLIENNKNQAIENFQKALELLADEKAILDSVYQLHNQDGEFIKTDLSKQLIQKINILGTYANSLQKAISIINITFRRIDIIGINNYQNKMQYINNDKDFPENDYHQNISKKVTKYSNIQRDDKDKINKIIKKFEKFDLVFNDLTIRYDSGTIDQACDTISKVVLGKENSINICLKGIYAEKVQSLLNPHIEIKEGTKESFKAVKKKSNLINIEVILDDKKLDYQKNLSDKEAEEFLKRQRDDNMRFNFTFQQANESSKKLHENVLPKASLNVDFLQLSFNDCMIKLEEIKAEKIELGIIGSKEDILKIIKEKNMENILIYLMMEKEKIKYEQGNTINIIEKIGQLKSEQFWIKICSLEKKEVEDVICKCKNATFNLNFIKIDTLASLKGFKEENLINVSFNGMGPNEANQLIQVLRKEYIDFSLIFTSLTKEKVGKTIQEAPIEQERIQIIKVKTLGELFMDESRPVTELLEFSARGIEYLLEINEMRFIPWVSITGVVIIAGIQLLTGSLLVATGFGSTAGIGIITEGAADIFTAYRAFSTRQFVWSDYAKQKAISLIISATSMGINAIKDTGSNLWQGIKQEALEQIGQRNFNKNFISKTLSVTYKNLKSLPFKQSITAIGEAGAREGLNQLADKLSHFALDQFKPEISSSIQSEVNLKFCSPTLFLLMNKMSALDKINKSRDLKNKIDKIVAEIINPLGNKYQKMWNSIGEPLCKGYLSDEKRLGDPFSMGMRIFGSLQGIQQITIIIDNLHDQLVKNLLQIDKDTLEIAHLLYRYCQIDKQDSREIVDILKKDEIILTETNLGKDNPIKFKIEYINPQAIEKKSEINSNHNPPKILLKEVNFGKHNKYKNTVEDFCKKLSGFMEQVEINDLSEIIKSVSDFITEQVIKIVEGNLISPWSSYGNGVLTKAISKRIQHTFFVDISQNTESQNQQMEEDQQQYQQLKLKKEKGQELSKQEKIWFDKYDPYNTFSKQIYYNAQDYMISYKQSETSYHVENRDNSRTNSQADQNKLEEFTKQIRQKKPATSIEMQTMIKEFGLDIIISESTEFELSKEEIAAGKRLLIFIKGNKDSKGNDSVGHWALKSQDNQFDRIQSDDGDCGYAAIQKILKENGINKSIDQLRQQTAEVIESNPRSYLKAIQSQFWLQDRYPKEANSLIFNGSMKAAYCIAGAGGVLISSLLSSPVITVIGVVVVGGVLLKFINEQKIEQKIKDEVILLEKKECVLTEQQDPNFPNKKYISLVPLKLQRVNGLVLKSQDKVFFGNCIVIGSYFQESVIELTNSCIALKNMNFDEVITRGNNSIIAGVKGIACSLTDLSKNEPFDQTRENVDNHPINQKIQKILNKKDEIKKSYQLINSQNQIEYLYDELKQYSIQKGSEWVLNQVIPESKYKKEIIKEKQDIIEGIQKIQNGTDEIL